MKKERIVYEIMHMDRVTARVSTAGTAQIVCADFLPFDLYLEPAGEDSDIDTLLNNLENFYHWCASRMLTLDRKYAKEILNCIGVPQAVTDRDRAAVSLSCRCVSLTDVFWVKKQGEEVTFSQVNLYDHSLNAAIIALPLKGRAMTATSTELAQDLSTKGCFAKAWMRDEEGFFLLKDGSADVVRKELLASEICRCFDVPQVLYEPFDFEGQPVTKSRLVTSKAVSMVSKMAFDIYAANHDIDTIKFCKELDPVSYYGMNLLDYLTGNTDRHPENWGFFVDNRTNRCISLYPLMDFNQCFLSYDTTDGAWCQTVLPQRITQKEAAAGGAAGQAVIPQRITKEETAADGAAGQAVIPQRITKEETSAGGAAGQAVIPQRITQKEAAAGGAAGQAVIPQRITQKEAALEAVRHIGLRQICEPDMQIFQDMPQEADMFRRRLEILKEAAGRI